MSRVSLCLVLLSVMGAACRSSSSDDCAKKSGIIGANGLCVCPDGWPLQSNPERCVAPAGTGRDGDAATSADGQVALMHEDGGLDSGEAGVETTDARSDFAVDGGLPDADNLGDSGPVVGDATGVAATAAVAFLSSLGVRVFVASGSDDYGRSASAMSYAGIRNLRDEGLPSAVTAWQSMHQSAGVRVCLMSNQDVASTVDLAKQLRTTDALLAVEGPNEPNNFPVTYQGQTSDSNTTFVSVAHFQRDLYAAVKAEPSLQGIPVFHASEAGGAEPDNLGLQFLTIPEGANVGMPDGTRYADYANLHNYVCATNNLLEDNTCWNASDPTLNGQWDGLFVEYGHTWKAGFSGYSNTELASLPRVTTETGWFTEGAGAITQEQQGRLLMNLYLSAFARGTAYTFVYTLRDIPGGVFWGLFDDNYQPKKSGTYLHNLTTILADTGASRLGKLSFSIGSQPSTVHSLLLQKSNGLFELVLWNDRPLGGSDNVTIDLSSTRATVRVYDPTTGTAATQTLTGVQTVALTLTDHPLVLEL